MQFDLVVIGSGPSGQKGAIAAAKLGKSVAIVEHRHQCLGGVCLHSGTIPSKTLREAILHLTGFRQRDVYSEQFRSKRKITMDSLRKKLESVTQTELDVIQEQFDRNGVEVLAGRAKFVDSNHVKIEDANGGLVVRGDKFLIACGTRPARPAHIPFDGKTVFDSDEILEIQKIPRSMVVIGAGVIGIEYAIMFATLGVEVTVVDGRTDLLEFCDKEIVEYLLFSARMLNMRFCLGEKVETVIRRSDGQAAVKLESKKHLVAETALFSVGREGESDTLNLESVDLECNARGRIDINESFQTKVENIYAVGDIVGFPSLASSAMEQGRRAALHAFGQDVKPLGDLPYGLYTIPEISMIGKNEQELTAAKVPYEVGLARYHEIARGQIIGDDTGMLKILFHQETRKILGVHCIGDLATEIVHIGQAVMAFGGKIDYFCETVFNYPTMAECYRVAAFNGLNRLSPEHHIEEEPSIEKLTRSSDLAANLSNISAALDVCETPMVSIPVN
ncbi:MAG: NAD(P) transhydrogenase [Mariniblastus sp.]|jgi:NAD(P) transhydrogenase